MAEIRWSYFAQQDLKDIHEYISIDSVFYADRFIDKILKRTDMLLDFPFSGRVVPEFQNDDIRELIEGNYRMIYRIEDAEKLAIIRIHHAARILK